MLVLTRKIGETVHVGSEITITILAIKGAQIRLGITAPAEVPVFRAELNDFLTPPTQDDTPTRPVQRPK